MLIFVQELNIILTSNEMLTKFNNGSIVLFYREHTIYYIANRYTYLDILKPSNEVVYSF